MLKISDRVLVEKPYHEVFEGVVAGISVCKKTVIVTDPAGENVRASADHVKRIHGNTGKRNRANGDSNATSNIHFRITQEDKALLVRNLETGESLAQFLIKLGRAEAERREGKQGERA